MSDRLEAIHKKYAKIGLDKGSSILLTRQEALSFLEDIRGLALVTIVEQWYPRQINGEIVYVEDYVTPDFDYTLQVDTSAHFNINEVISYILNGLPDNIERLSFILIEQSLRLVDYSIHGDDTVILLKNDDTDAVFDGFVNISLINDGYLASIEFSLSDLKLHDANNVIEQIALLYNVELNGESAVVVFKHVLAGEVDTTRKPSKFYLNSLGELLKICIPNFVPLE